MITLKKNAERRVRRGHLWVFSNEIADPPVSQLEAGSVHELRDSSGDFLGIVYANPASLITARILTRKRLPIDGLFFRSRIEDALSLRERVIHQRDAYRLVFGESDLLPGLVVDRYGQWLSVQSQTAGMDRLLDLAVEALVDLLRPEGIFLRNDSPGRALEGLASEKRLLFGEVPDTVIISSWGSKFMVDIPNGQKTGFFLDQEHNRPLMKQYVPEGGTVLDLFCYTAAWGIHAAAAGASQVTAVDSSRGALNLAVANAALNNFEDRLIPVKESAVDFLKKARDSWDVVVLDPPAFIKSRNQIKEGVKGYIDVNRRALLRVKHGGFFVTCSCSHHLDSAGFETLLAAASHQSGRELRILDFRGQGPDHPILLSMPETRYLKVLVAQVM